MLELLESNKISAYSHHEENNSNKIKIVKICQIEVDPLKL